MNPDMETGEAAVSFRRLDSCTFRQGLQLWNEGFAGYVPDMTFSLEKYVSHLADNAIRPDVSIAAFSGDRPIGFVLLAVREAAGVTYAWNGGTGVHPHFRGRGMAGRLMQEAVLALQEEGVDVAILEVLQHNKNAVAAYERAGFVIQDRIYDLRLEGPLAPGIWGVGRAERETYRIDTIQPAALARLPFYRSRAAWPSQWFQHARGRAVIVRDSHDRIAGYALVQRETDEQDNLLSVKLAQCEADPARADAAVIVRRLLGAVFEPEAGAFIRQTCTLSAADPTVTTLLMDAGFHTLNAQYLMIKSWREGKAGGR